MIETQLSIFDAVVLGIMLVSCLFAFFRGFVREILSLGAWIGAALVTIYYFPAAAEKLQPHFKSPVVAAGFATLGVYIAALVGFSFINMLIIKFLKSGDEVGLTDNLLGLLFGAARGAFVISLGYFMMAFFLPEDEKPSWMEHSITEPYVKQGAQILAKVAPDYLKDISSLEQKMAPAAGGDEPIEETGKGYNPDSRRKLDRLIDSMNRSNENE